LAFFWRDFWTVATLRWSLASSTVVTAAILGVTVTAGATAAAAGGGVVVAGFVTDVRIHVVVVVVVVVVVAVAAEGWAVLVGVEAGLLSSVGADSTAAVAPTFSSPCADAPGCSAALGFFLRRRLNRRFLLEFLLLLLSLLVVLPPPSLLLVPPPPLDAVDDNRERRRNMVMIKIKYSCNTVVESNQCRTGGSNFRWLLGNKFSIFSFSVNNGIDNATNPFVFFFLSLLY